MQTLLVLLSFMAYADTFIIPHKAAQKAQARPLAEDTNREFILDIAAFARDVDRERLEQLMRMLKKTEQSRDKIPAAAFAIALEDKTWFNGEIGPILFLASEDIWEKFITEKLEEFESQKPKDEKFARGLERLLEGYARANYNFTLKNHRQKKLRASFKTLKSKLFGSYKRMTPNSEQFNTPPYSAYLETGVMLGDMRAVLKCRSILAGAYLSGEPQSKEIRKLHAQRASDALYLASAFQDPEFRAAAAEAIAPVVPMIKAKPEKDRAEWELQILDIYEDQQPKR